MFALFLLSIGFLARVLSHTPNFTPVIALILFGGVYLEKKYAFLLPIFLMMLTDIILGVHNVMAFTWGSLVVIAFLGSFLRQKKNWVSITITSIASAAIFFVITNFGVWVVGYYPPTIKGLIDCYFMAIPFFRMTLVSTLMYSFVFFGVYEIVAMRLRQTRFASVL